jgi:hypothetical protein
MTLNNLTSGDPALRAIMNELFAIARKVENISGNGEVQVSHTANGINISVERRRSGGGGSGSGTSTRWAKLTEDATASDTIHANLLGASDGIADEETETTLYAEILNSSRLDLAMPRLSEGDIIPVTERVYDNEGTPVTRWYIVDIFYGSDDYWSFD